MDFNTVLANIEARVYDTAVEAIEDVVLIFKNCYQYNPPGDVVCQMAKYCEDVVVERMKKCPADRPVTPEASRPSVDHSPSVSRDGSLSGKRAKNTNNPSKERRPSQSPTMNTPKNPVKSTKNDQSGYKSLKSVEKGSVSGKIPTQKIKTPSGGRKPSISKIPPGRKGQKTPPVDSGSSSSEDEDISDIENDAAKPVDKESIKTKLLDKLAALDKQRRDVCTVLSKFDPEALALTQADPPLAVTEALVNGKSLKSPQNKTATSNPVNSAAKSDGNTENSGNSNQAAQMQQMLQCVQKFPKFGHFFRSLE